ncbi:MULTISPECIES: N-6 DNA methylase [Desulfitobacterium]|nr:MULTISPECIES: N-6 DNA methylase [Desulfitobacterium]
MNSTQNSKEIIRLIRLLGQKHNSWQIFEDFLAMSAISISNAIDWTHREEREAQYMEIVGRYEKNEPDLFSKMLYHLVEELERHAEVPRDVLGPVFHELELHNKYRGQFFTPQEICNMMGRITLGEKDLNITERGYITVAEPCAGSGAMILGFAKAMTENQYNIHKQMVVTATDVDLKCVFMTYLQLSLYGIPAVVIHGDTIQMKEWSRWYTPVYLLDGWMWRQECGNSEQFSKSGTEVIKRISEPLYGALKDLDNLIISKNENRETA